ncbi:MAG: hypothetical protein AAFY60_20095, partial [Myxococcota bacterium]
RTNLEQWRVAVVRSEALEDSEREMIQMLMSVARKDVESGYSLIARELPRGTAAETLEYALRRTRRALTAVLIELAKLTPHDSSISELQKEDLEQALRARASYARLTRLVSSQDGPLADRFEILGVQLEQLLSGVDGVELRLTDVSSFEGILDRIRDWQRSPSATTGEQLWSELTSVVSLVRGINQREVLRVHDRALLRELEAALEESSVPNSLWSKLRPLVGLDPELDEILLDPDGRSPASSLRAGERLVTLAAMV